jgi:hypothetical protein
MTFHRYSNWREVARLLTCCRFEHFLYRQLTMVCGSKGIRQYNTSVENCTESHEESRNLYRRTRLIRGPVDQDQDPNLTCFPDLRICQQLVNCCARYTQNLGGLRLISTDMFQNTHYVAFLQFL